MKNLSFSNPTKTFLSSLSLAHPQKGCNGTTAKKNGPRSLLTILVATLSLMGADASVANAAATTNAPVQSELNSKKTYKKAGHQLEAVAAFQVQAKVLSAAQYRTGREAKISPVDLALGWNKMASDTLLSQVAVTQSGRFASMQYDPTQDINVNDIIHNSSNVHMIPATRELDKTLHGIKKGQIVQIEGYLVNIRHKDGWRWLTSTSRTDRGDGACEILLVKAVKIIG